MKFKGILLASDWDRTLSCNGTVPKENQDAIRYFQANGGLFTVCSGRSWDYIDGFKDVVRPNTYSIAYNGAYIYHLDDKKLLYEGFVDEHLFDILDSFIPRAKGVCSVVLYCSDNTTPLTIDEYHRDKVHYMQTNIYKCVVTSDNPDNGQYNADLASSLELFDYIAVRSWPTGLEFFKESNAKGTALKRVAKAEGALLTVAVGDYENDIQMIQAADIGYAVENAVDSVKSSADRITVHCKDSAIAAIINELEREIDSGKLVLNYE